MWGSRKQAEDIVLLKERLSSLTEAVEKLQRRESQRDADVRAMQTEWESTYQKFSTLWARLRKRTKTKEPENGPGDQIEAQLGPNPLAIRLLKTGGQ